MKTIIWLLLLCICISAVPAQSDFDKWKAEQNKSFKEFREEEDKRFAEFLEDEWKRFQAFRGVVFDATPKLNNAPVRNALEASTDSGSRSEGNYVLAVDEDDLNRQAESSAAENGDTSEIVFYGRTIRYSHPETPSFRGRVDNTSIASFWRQLSASGFADLAAALASAAEQLRLDGWGTGVLAAELAGKCYPESQSSRRLACWYLMVRNGYDVRVGYSGSDIFLLVPSRNMLFDTPYFTIQGSNYYIHDFIGIPGIPGALYIYESKFDSSSRAVEFAAQNQPDLGKTIYKRKYSFKFRGRQYGGYLNFNKALVDYYRTIPHTDSSMYFHIALSDDFLDSIQDEFSAVLKTMNEKDKVQFLLTFVQTAFEYKTDQQQFGYEKWMLPEEAMFYRYIDCEDRSILFTSLVRHLLGLRVIGLDWPGHIAAAVRFSGSVAGTYVPYSGSRFIICDPTYINADVGMVMPDFIGKSVKIIPAN